VKAIQHHPFLTIKQLIGVIMVYRFITDTGSVITIKARSKMQAVRKARKETYDGKKSAKLTLVAVKA